MPLAISVSLSASIVRFAGASIKAGERAKIVVVSLKAFGRFALGALDFGALQLRRDCADHAACHPILQIENIFKQAVEPIRPEMRSRCGIDELSGDADAIAQPCAHCPRARSERQARGQPV